VIVRLREKRILLTGASGGIGRELARLLAAKGAVLAIAGRRREALEAVADEIAATGAERPLSLVADLASPGSAADLGRGALSELGAIDVLINNAASGLQGFPSAVGDRDEARRLFEINFWSPMALIQAVVPSMREHRSGTVVNVTSLAYMSPFPPVGHYCASKAAFALATQTLRFELRRYGVRVLEVIPGTVDTPGSYENRQLEGGNQWIERALPTKPDRIARAMVKAIERGRNRLIFPRRLGPGYEIPLLSRLYARSVAKYADPDRTPVRSTGDLDNPASVAVREEWERKHRAAAKTG
jgi:short-subunit dehydrogenase